MFHRSVREAFASNPHLAAQYDRVGSSIEQMLASLFPGSLLEIHAHQAGIAQQQAEEAERYIPKVGEAFYITALDEECDAERFVHRAVARDDMMIVSTIVGDLNQDPSLKLLVRIDSVRFTPAGDSVLSALGIEKLVAVATPTKG